MVVGRTKLAVALVGAAAGDSACTGPPVCEGSPYIAERVGIAKEDADFFLVKPEGAALKLQPSYEEKWPLHRCHPDREQVRRSGLPQEDARYKKFEDVLRDMWNVDLISEGPEDLVYAIVRKGTRFATPCEPKTEDSLDTWWVRRFYIFRPAVHEVHKWPVCRCVGAEQAGPTPKRVVERSLDGDVVDSRTFTNTAFNEGGATKIESFWKVELKLVQLEVGDLPELFKWFAVNNGRPDLPLAFAIPVKEESAFLELTAVSENVPGSVEGGISA